MSVQMANEANLCMEESWTVRTKNDSGRGCGSVFSKLPVLLSYSVPSCFIGFCSMFDNFTPLV